MTTLRDVAREVEVSVSTVSRALNGHPHIDEGTRRRVREAAERLGYRPNALARALRKNRTMTVGLVIPDILNYFYAAGAGVLQATLEQHGYRLIICISNDDPRSDEGYLTALLEEQVDGIVHVPCTPQGARVVREQRQEVPVVELNRISDYGEFDAVVSDDREGSYQLGRHLLELGHRQVGVIAGPPEYSTTRSRLAGFRQAFLEAGIGDEGLEVRHGEYSLEWGAQGAGEILALSPQPTALFATGNSIILGALRTLTNLGMQVPGDLSLIGFDDPAWCSVWRPAITTYALPLRDMGLLAAQLLVSRMRSGGAESMPSVTRVSGRLMLRGSSGAPHRPENRGRELATADADISSQ